MFALVSPPGMLWLCASPNAGVTYPPARSTTRSIVRGFVNTRRSPVEYTTLVTNFVPSNHRPFVHAVVSGGAARGTRVQDAASAPATIQ